MADSVLALCAGYGGLELAVRLACPGSRVVGYVEREAHSASVLLARMEDQALEPAPVWCGDLADLDASLFRGVGMVTAGFPCQPWSAAGQGRGFDDERWIWPDIARIVRDVGPRLVFLENVPGLLVRGGLGAVLGDLAEMGFDAEWGVLSAADAGASQIRERVYVLAYAGSARRPEVARGPHGDEGPDARWATIDGAEPDGGDEALDDTDDKRLPRARLLIERQRDAGRSGNGVLVDALCGGGGSRIRQRWTPGRSNSDRPGGRLGYADDVQGRGRPDPHEGRQQPEWSGADVADTLAGDGGRLHEGRGEEGGTEHGRAPAGPPGKRTAATGLFPPGPDDLGAWADILAVDPSLEPSLRRLADGPAGGVDGYDDPTRTDQLRSLGNGVVPLAGALALCLLAERAGVTL